MRIVVFGAGGARGYFGAMLAGAGEDVTFIARGPHLHAIRAHGFLVQTPKGDILIENAYASGDPSTVGVADVILLGVKTWQVTEAARALLPMIGEHTVVVPLQNGVEAPGQLIDALGETHVLGGLCGTLSWIAGPGRICSIGDSHFIKFGRMDNRQDAHVERLRRAFEHAGVNVEVPPNTNAALWKKFLFVTSPGGVGAVTRVPAGVIRTVPELRGMVQQCMKEVCAIARARGILLGADVVDVSMTLIDSLPGSGTTSLQRDIMEAKPSEIEAWNGALVRMGKEMNIETPLHRFIYASLLPAELHARGRISFVMNLRAS